MVPEPVKLSCCDLRFFWKCKCGFVFIFHPTIALNDRSRRCPDCGAEYKFDVEIHDNDPMGVPDWFKSLLKPALKAGPCRYAACKEEVNDESKDEPKIT